MTFQQFIESHNGKYIDFDGAFGAQCMDLAHFYCVEVFGLTDPRILAAPSARDVYINYNTVYGHELFEKIDNSPTNVPKEGDIMYWGNAPYGHVAVFIEGDANSFRSFDQNFPTGSPCHVQNHNYNNVVGWLRFKKSTNSELEVCNTKLIEEMKAKEETYKELTEWKERFTRIAQKLNKPADLDIILPDIDRLLTLEGKLIEKEKLVQQKEEQFNTIQSQAQVMGNQILELEKENDTLQKSLQALTENSEKQSKEIEELKIKIDQLKEIQPVTKLSFTDLIGEIISRFIRR